MVVSGAMIPLHFPHSDARRNLIMSVICASSLHIPEVHTTCIFRLTDKLVGDPMCVTHCLLCFVTQVCIYSNDKLLRGNRTTKIANMSVDAFLSPNHPILASTGVETTIEHDLILPYPRRR